ncbi:unnamed protein product [Menidia menidia]|uniref:(Atlantic silverside) hypothetical protein n=1 Tax=Menidia menidia TaxID=238744 RepID=A0A8S4AUS7_9TELE|nr:unnamed protein product [Menidia menidia]
MKQNMETSWAPGPLSLLSLSGCGPLAPPADCFSSSLNQRRGTVQRLDLTVMCLLRRVLNMSSWLDWSYLFWLHHRWRLKGSELPFPLQVEAQSGGSKGLSCCFLCRWRLKGSELLFPLQVEAQSGGSKGLSCCFLCRWRLIVSELLGTLQVEAQSV